MNRKSFLFIILVVFSFSLVGCGAGTEASNNTIVDVYRNAALEFVDSEDYDSAISVLEEGIATTNDETLRALLLDVESMNTEIISNTNNDDEADENHAEESLEPDVETFDLSDYAVTSTYWASDDISWEFGGYMLAIYVEENFDRAYFELSYIQSAPMSRNAVASMDIKLSELTSNEVNLHFDEDGWGHSGNVKLTFEADEIIFTVGNIEYDGESVESWGFIGTSGTLVRNPDVYELLDYTEAEYNEKHPNANDHVDTTVTGIYDDVVGTYINDTSLLGSEGAIYLFIGYADATKQAAYVRLCLTYGECEMEIKSREGDCIVANEMGNGSEPLCAIDLDYLSSWGGIGAMIFVPELGYVHELVTFEPISAQAEISNPYYTS